MSQWKGYSPDNKPSGASVAEPGPHSAANAGALTYEPHYGLKAKPFSLSTDPRVLFTAPGHAEALDELLSAIRRREGIIVVTGEMGTGKSTLCRAALYQLDRKTFTTFVPDPFLSREDLLRMLLVDFGEVSVNDLRQGRLSGASRPDMSYQLYEFLTSLESVDAFAVLVIDEAQHLSGPLLDEIRALSELEAGRRLLQIVLVGQPDLETHLKQYHMRHIEQRVTTRCEVKPLTRDDVSGYVGHRLALAGGTKERVSFSPAALDLIYKTSAGVPRVINLVCDRALSLGHGEQITVISPAIVAKAMQDLRLASAPLIENVRTTPAPRLLPSAPAVPNAFDELTAMPPAAAPGPKATPAPAASTAGAYDLHSLLDLSPTIRQEQEHPRDDHTTGVAAAPSWKSRVAAERSRRKARFRFLRMLVLPLIGLSVIVIAGGAVFYMQRGRAANNQAQAARPKATAPAPATILPSAVPGSRVAPSVATRSAAPIAPAALNAPIATAASAALPTNATTDAWIVQVAAFSRSDRAAALVDRLMQSGLPAYQMAGNAGEQGLLHFVRIGPYRAAEQANAARAKLLQWPEFEGAFVRNMAPQAPNAEPAQER
jgi:type II secretory pathway predicted ATPase ExeA/cell division septation protein DedD